MANCAEKKTIELWAGYEVEVNEQLLDDFDFMSELTDALRSNDIATVTSMYFAIVGGDEVYKATRKHIEDEYGYFAVSELGKITKKIDAVFPKAGNRAQRRSWQTSK